MKLVMLILMSVNVMAADFFVDSPRSERAGYQKTCINIDACESCVYVKNEDFDSFSKQLQEESNESGKMTLRAKLVKQAFDRRDNGCK